MPNKRLIIFRVEISLVSPITEDLTPVFELEDVGGYGRDLALYLIKQKYIVKFVNSSLFWDAQCVTDVLIRKLPYLPDTPPSDIHWIISQLVGRRNALVKA
ncbi:hypothetical protein [Shouchella tritolerans]|uniref:hypothetical protein n=1 Tax=Shouchella tritolerans TaxID=2979466 RepID=UPI0021E8F609|nr:hypothetical protein [Shouchella tritolerans]